MVPPGPRLRFAAGLEDLPLLPSPLEPADSETDGLEPRWRFGADERDWAASPVGAFVLGPVGLSRGAGTAAGVVGELRVEDRGWSAVDKARVSRGLGSARTTDVGLDVAPVASEPAFRRQSVVGQSSPGKGTASASAQGRIRENNTAGTRL